MTDALSSCAVMAVGSGNSLPNSRNSAFSFSLLDLAAFLLFSFMARTSGVSRAVQKRWMGYLSCFYSRFHLEIQEKDLYRILVGFWSTMMSLYSPSGILKRRRLVCLEEDWSKTGKTEDWKGMKRHRSQRITDDYEYHPTIGTSKFAKNFYTK